MKPRRKKHPNKIKDNPSIAKMGGALKSAKVLTNALVALKRLDRDQIKKLDNVASNFNELSVLPDKFNEYFSKRGWIAYESMEVEVMRLSISEAAEGKMDEAEQRLVDFYTNEHGLKIRIGWLRNLKHFEPRREIIEKALIDHLEERFHASIPVLLLTIDGLVNDITADQKGFFAENPDVSALDSIAGHSSGLLALATLFQSGRKKTNTEPIYLPYRNGILHGRDINYANSFISCKLWAALFAVADLARSLQNKKVVEKPTSLMDTLRMIADNEKIKNFEKAWVKREHLLDIEPRNFDSNSPEKALMDFLETLQRGQYGKLVPYLGRNTTIAPVPDSTLAKELKERYQQSHINDYRIVRIEDIASATSEINVTIEYVKNNESLSNTTCIRMHYMDHSNSNFIPRNSAVGHWTIIENGLIFLYS